MEERPVDARLRRLLRPDEVAELLIVEEIVEPGADAVRQRFGHIHVAEQTVGAFVQQLVLQDEREVVLVDRERHPVAVL